MARKGRGDGNRGEKDHLVDKAVDGKIILKWMFKAYDMGGVDWIDLTQDRDKHSCRWEDNIKMDVQCIGYGGHGLD